MGGCCCCPTRRVELVGTPVYYFCPRDLEEHNSLSSIHGPGSAIPIGYLANTNLETSDPDTYRAPPTPLPYDMDLRSHQHALPGIFTGDKNCGSIGETISGCSLQTLLASVDAGETDIKKKTDGSFGIPDAAELQNELLVSAPCVEDGCPICLEDYDEENPRILTKCDHHFHLACILEWMERSDTCPICDKDLGTRQKIDGGSEHGGLYYLDQELLQSTGATLHIRDSLILWHLRLGHPSL